MPNSTPAIFNGNTINIVHHLDQQWITAADVAKSLGYSYANSISQLYSRHKEEFEDSMSLIVKLTINGKRYDTRVFNKRGCQLLALFAKSKKAANFRKWVLDVLEGGSTPQAAPTAIEPPNTAQSLSSINTATVSVDVKEVIAALIANAQATSTHQTITVYLCPNEEPVIKTMQGKLSVFPNAAVKKYVDYTQKSMGMSMPNLKAELEFLQSGSIIDPEVYATGGQS